MRTQLVTSAGRVPDALEAMRMGSVPDIWQEAQRLEIILRPATEAEAMETIAFMFKLLPMENQGETDEEKDEISDAMIAGYKLALRGHPKWAIREARDAFIAGKVPGYSSSFAPRPPDLGREVSRRVDSYQEKLQRVRRSQDESRQLRDLEMTGPRSPAMKALGDKRVAELRALADEDRRARAGAREIVPEWTDPNPITAEMLADVPDAEPRKTTMQKAPIPDTFKNLKRTA